MLFQTQWRCLSVCTPERTRAHKYPKHDWKAEDALRREILEQYEQERINEIKAEQHEPVLWPGGRVTSPEEDRQWNDPTAPQEIEDDVLSRERAKERRQRRKAVVTGKEASIAPAPRPWRHPGHPDPVDVKEIGEGLSAIWAKLSDNPEIHQTLLGLMRSTGTPNINPNS